MKHKYIIGIDPGVGSLGISLRNTERNALLEQIEVTNVDIVRSGVVKNGEGKYVSFAAERRSFRNTRTMYRHRKRRKQETLKLLINEDVVLDENIKHVLCPLSKEELDKWVRYDKNKGYKREYPTDSVEFSHWMMLDFNNDGKVDDYSSPFQIRKELVERQFDFSQKEDCYKLGRALYHIAQRRGFKSNKGSINDSDVISIGDNQDDDFDSLEYSEKKKSKTLTAYMNQLQEKGHERVTVGFALACLENDGVRLRDSEYQAIRTQLKEEITTIFKFQKQLSLNSTLYKRLVSEKKNDGTIFYQCPIKSQKGNVESCTLEPRKKRCQVSHPEFEKYRAWSFINNIRIKLLADSEPQMLPYELRMKLFDKITGTVSKTIDFIGIRKLIEKEVGEPLSANEGTINFKDDYSLSGCPTIGRLRKILGDDWETKTIEIGQTRRRNKNQEVKDLHTISYGAIDLWHICTTMENETAMTAFLEKKMPFDEEQKKEMMRLYRNASSDYANFSVYALQRINRFLISGCNNYKATILAKIPDIIGKEQWEQYGKEIEKDIQNLITQNREEKRYLAIANQLIADYKSQDEDDRDHNYEYQLTELDWRDVENKIKESIGKVTWTNIPTEEQNAIKLRVGELYQQFFKSYKRDYYKLPNDTERIQSYLSERFSLDLQKVQQIYTPSSNKYYPPAQRVKGVFQLGSPAKSALRNPSAMRILYLLRRRINELMERYRDMEPDNTRIVVELPRELNDANMRRAIDLYQERRKKENNIFKEMIGEILDVNEEERVEKTRLLIEQSPEYLKADFEERFQKHKEPNSYTRNVYNDTIEYATTKYRLWLEQGCVDIYTGHTIPFSHLFDANMYDIEHTIPRSIVLEDSLENKTITSAFFNQKVKGNLLPSQLPNYNDVIMPNLQPWKDRVERLNERVRYWLRETKRAADPDRKNYCIVQRHLWQIELNYWSSKLNRFLMTEVKTDFVNKQMSDTRVISKYVYHYLKSCFSSVDVQYGCTNAVFRKILGIQAKDEEKDRSVHTHHAIDATVLTFIPSSSKRCEMMRLFFQIDEAKKAGNIMEEKRLKKQLEEEKNLCLYGRTNKKHSDKNLADLVRDIQETTFVNHSDRDQALTPAKRRGVFRKNGTTYNVLKTGDCIRGKLHKEKFFGAITQWEKDADGLVVKDAMGQHVVDTSNVKYVIRVKLQYKQGRGEGFKSWEELKARMIDKSLYRKLEEQHPNETFAEACKKGFYTMRKIHGEFVRNRIRHVRCEISDNQGHISIKKHLNRSKKDYKRFYYAAPADLLCACEYKGVKEQKYEMIRLFDISQNRKDGKEDIPTSIQGKKEILHLVRVIRMGDMVLLYKDIPNELDGLDKKQLAKRLYRVDGFEKSGIIKLVKHDKTKEDGRGKAYGDFEERISQSIIRMSITKIKFVPLINPR